MKTTGFLTLALLLSTACAVAAEPIRIEGTVKILDRKGQEPAAASIEINSNQVYRLEMDERGRSLAKVMNRERAEILGIPEERDGKNWLRVLGYPDPRLTAAHELWRRTRCNACVVFPANVNATPPANLHGTEPVTGRQYFDKEHVMAWTRDAAALWLATDTRILQVDLAGARVVAAYDFPANWIYQLASDGQTLWIVYKGGVAALDIREKTLRDLPTLQSAFARVLVDGTTAWVLTDAGTFRFQSGTTTPFPALPTGARIRKAVETGLWTPHWQRRTSHFIASPVALDGNLYVASYGDVYGLEKGEWRKIAPQGTELAAGSRRLWFLTPKGVADYDPATQKLDVSLPPDLGSGRLSHLLLSDGSLWVAVDPEAASEEKDPTGGGLARLDIASTQWTTWKQINGADASHVACFGTDAPAFWSVTARGAYKIKPAHPGMTYVKKRVFETEGFALNRFDPATAAWSSLALDLPVVDERLICGQDGTRAMDRIVPRAVDAILVAPQNVFASVRLIPKDYFGGYWPAVARAATRGAATQPWTGGLALAPAELGLDGEQPLVLNISNGELIRNPLDVGERVLEAIGHDNVLGLFAHQGRAWAVTEGGAGRYDEAAGRWGRVAELGFRYYWRATAAVDDGRWLYIGSDRGVISRLEIATGRFVTLAALSNRMVTALARNAAGEIVAAGGMAPLGQFPPRYVLPATMLDADAATFDGQNWKERREPLPPAEPPAWLFQQFEKRNDFDKSDGNFLLGPAPNGQGTVPRYYLKEVFFPHFLCASPNGKRLWASTFNGLVRIDLP
jgi:ligand-binding sensor domain-containing protein